MTKNDFLEAVAVFSRECFCDMLLPCAVQSEDEAQVFRPPEIHKMRLPDSSEAKKKAPYVIHQVISSTDSQKAGRRTESGLFLRSVFCVYNENEEEGALALLEMTERFRIALLKKRVIDDRFEIELDEENLETLIYPDDTAPYYAAEVITAWRMPSIEREDVYRFI